MDIQTIIQGVNDLRELPEAIPKALYLQKMANDRPNDLTCNDFVVLLKPECFSPTGEGDEGVFTKIAQILQQNDVFVHAMTLMNSSYIRLHSVVENQYRMLNMYAQYGLEISPMFGKLASKGCYVGAYSFLNTYKQFSAANLEEIAHSVGCEKLGNGLYSVKIDVGHKPVNVLNPFHPFQVDHFQKKDSVMLALLCTSKQTYEKVADDVIGFFDPSQANKGSIRRQLFSENEALGRNFSTMYNAVHNSPGPLEGLFSAIRYFIKQSGSSVQLEDIPLGNEILKSLPVSKDDVMQLRYNPCVKTKSFEGMLFDLLEGKDNKQTLDVLSEVFAK